MNETNELLIVLEISIPVLMYLFPIFRMTSNQWRFFFKLQKTKLSLVIATFLFIFLYPVIFYVFLFMDVKKQLQNEQVFSENTSN